MNLKMLTILVVVTPLLGCSPSHKDEESGVEMIERCYDGVVYVSNITSEQQSLSVKFNRDGTVSTKLSNGIECK